MSDSGSAEARFYVHIARYRQCQRTNLMDGSTYAVTSSLSDRYLPFRCAYNQVTTFRASYILSSPPSHARSHVSKIVLFSVASTNVTRLLYGPCVFFPLFFAVFIDRITGGAIAVYLCVLCISIFFRPPIKPSTVGTTFVTVPLTPTRDGCYAMAEETPAYQGYTYVLRCRF